MANHIRARAAASTLPQKANRTTLRAPSMPSGEDCSDPPELRLSCRVSVVNVRHILRNLSNRPAGSRRPVRLSKRPAGTKVLADEGEIALVVDGSRHACSPCAAGLVVPYEGADHRQWSGSPL